MQSTQQSHSATPPPPLRHGQCDQLTNHIQPSSLSDTASAINSPITFSHPPSQTRPVQSTHQSHSAILPLRHGQCDQLTNHIQPSSLSDTASAINSPITFCHPPSPTRPVRSTHQSHSAILPLRHGQCNQLNNHILPSSLSDTASAINSPITFSHPPSPTRPVRSTHQSHSAILPLRHGQCNQLNNHILPSSLSDTASAINSPITFSHPPSPTRPVRSTHQSHSAILPLRHGQCDQLTNHILPSSLSDTASAINSPITFCHPPLRHDQYDHLVASKNKVLQCVLKLRLKQLRKT